MLRKILGINSNKDRNKCLRHGKRRPPSVSDLGVTKYVRLEDDVKYGLVDIVKVKEHDYYFLVKENDLDDWCIRKSIDEDGKGYLVGLDDEAEFYLVTRYIMEPTRRKRRAMKHLMIYWANGSIKKKRLFNREFILFLVAITCVSLFAGYFTSMYGLFMTTARLPPDNNVAYTDGSLIKTHIETLRLLDDSYWPDLSLQERLDIMQCVANIEATYLGLPETITVKTGELQEGVLGSYHHTGRIIKISTSYLMSEINCGYSNLELLLHEIFHSYQYWLVAAYNTVDDRYKNLYLFEHIRDYEIELNPYNNVELSYFARIIELHANSFASYATSEYIYKIDALLAEYEE